MAKTRSKTPALISQSKLLCFSLLYLSTSLFSALYASLSKPKCLFRSSSSSQTPLFSYPPSYGQHKYALQTLRSTCSSPLFFSDYSTVVKEIEDLCNKAPSESDHVLRYMQVKKKSDSFGGNFSARERRSYFHHRNDTSRVPCGFFKEFPVSDPDRTAMENCRGVVVVSAIFNDHDKIRQPRGLGSKTLDNVCFYMFVDDVTLTGLERLVPQKPCTVVGAWKIVRVSSEGLYGDDPAMNGVVPKHLVHRLFPNAKYSVWVDAKLQLTVDPLLLIHALVVSEKADVAVSKHPFFVHTMEEAMATSRWKKWRDLGGLRRQMETYCEFGLKPWSNQKLPYTSDVPDSGLILRKHGVESNMFSCLLFNELEGFNPRDQLAFAYVRDQMRPKLKVNMFEVEVFEHIVMEYRHNLKKSGTASRSTLSETKMASFVNSSCHDYLLKMWSEIKSHD